MFIKINEMWGFVYKIKQYKMIERKMFMILREDYIYENNNLMMKIYQDSKNPKQWLIDVLNWNTGVSSTMKITKNKAQSLLDGDKSWEEKTQEQIDKELAMYLGVKSLDKYYKGGEQDEN